MNNDTQTTQTCIMQTRYVTGYATFFAWPNRGSIILYFMLLKHGFHLNLNELDLLNRLAWC